MERALHITKVKNLKYIDRDSYRRIYWGVEFCQNLIPRISDTEKVLRFINRNGLGFTLVTPFVTEQGLMRLKEIFGWLKGYKMKIEVVVNDPGALWCLYTDFRGAFEIISGRLLARQQRNPEMARVLERQTPFYSKSKEGKIDIFVHKLPDGEYRKGIRSSYVNSSLFRDFLLKFGIKRVELNNVIQGFNLEGCKFKISLYTPFVNISTTRFCPMQTRRQKIYRINVCRRECQAYYSVLSCKSSPLEIYKRGNTIFYTNPQDEKKAEIMGIDRIIFQPELPS